MRIPKFPAIICVAALMGMVSFNVKGQDTASQAKARELLRQKMAELNGQPAAPASPAPAPAPVQPAPPVAPAQPATSTPPATTSWDARSANTDQIEKAREAMRQKINELNAQQGTSTTAPVAGNSKSLNADNETRAREAVRQERAKATAANQAAAEAAAKQKADAALAAKEKAMATASAKSMPASSAPAPTNLTPGSKEQRLYDLLQQYKADKISPAEYHEQRAKILSE